VGRERCAFIATLLLHHLNEDDLAAPDYLLDLVRASAASPHPLRHLFQCILGADRFDGLGCDLGGTFLGSDRLTDDLRRLGIVVVFFDLGYGAQLDELGSLQFLSWARGLGDFMDEFTRLHGDGRALLARRGVDLVVGIWLEPRDGQRLGGGRARPLNISAALVTVTAAASTPAATPCSGIVLCSLLSGSAALFRSLLLEQGLPVGDRNLVVVGMNFGE